MSVVRLQDEPVIDLSSHTHSTAVSNGNIPLTMSLYVQCQALLTSRNQWIIQQPRACCQILSVPLAQNSRPGYDRNMFYCLLWVKIELQTPAITIPGCSVFSSAQDTYSSKVSVFTSNEHSERKSTLETTLDDTWEHFRCVVLDFKFPPGTESVGVACQLAGRETSSSLTIHLQV